LFGKPLATKIFTPSIERFSPPAYHSVPLLSIPFAPTEPTFSVPATLVIAAYPPKALT